MNPILNRTKNQDPFYEGSTDRFRQHLFHHLKRAEKTHRCALSRVARRMFMFIFGENLFAMRDCGMQDSDIGHRSGGKLDPRRREISINITYRIHVDPSRSMNTGGAF